MQKIINGHGEKKDLEDIKSWSNIIRTSSRCGLGQMSNNSLLQAIAKFPDVFDKALDENSDYNPAFNMETATAEYDRIIKEINANYE